MHVEFALTAGCPVKCVYCPQDKYVAAYKQLAGPRITSLDDFKRMLANVGDATQKVDFSGYTEPLCNPYWFEIISHTVDEGYSVTVFSTLKGASWEDVEKLSGLAVREVYVHAVPGITDLKK